MQCGAPGIVPLPRLGAIMGWFYSHLARLIYAESVLFPLINVTELQEVVDLRRKDYCLEEIAGEAILPNRHLFHRESLLYTDVVAGESGELSWNDPLEIIQSPDSAATEEFPPLSLLLVEAMAMLGIFSLQGLKATSEVWDKVEFAGPKGHSDAMELVLELVDCLVRETCQLKVPWIHICKRCSTTGGCRCTISTSRRSRIRCSNCLRSAKSRLHRSVDIRTSID